MAISRVGLSEGTNRRESVRRSVELVRDDLAGRMGKEVILKPNFLSGNNPLVCTHVDALRGVLDVIMTLPQKPERILVAEGGNESYSGEAFRHFGYTDLIDEYDIPIELVDLNEETRWLATRVYMVDGTWQMVRMPRTILDCPCVISVAVAKTHDGAMVTLALKNLIMGTIRKSDRIKVHGFVSHKEREHPAEARALNRNLVRLAKHMMPDFSVIDGTIGIQGNGPGGTDTVPLGLSAASADTISVDAVISKAMGFEPLEVGTVFYADALELGTGDLRKIDILGSVLSDHIRTFKPHDTIELQRKWAFEGDWSTAKVT
ncbi:MAG: DUF362 domain-containing protein [Candidatus Latescibacteria bacterium]|jgi:uncharacterized protein (DUF362 family)|nr:DUF362 domain-containing protein [Candidatus Latescibacterota bacterium]